MQAHRWLGLSFAIATASVAFTSCKTTAETSTEGAGGSTSASSSSEAASGSSSSGSAHVDAGPIVCKSTYSTVPKGTCDPLQQDCPPGKTCRPVKSGSSYATACVGGTGLKTEGELCYNHDDAECDAHLFCVGGKCGAVCCKDNGEPCNGGTCNFQQGYGSGFMLFCRYAQKCDLFMENACPTGFGCRIEDPVQGLATCGEPSGAFSPDLGTCKFLNDCADMEHCYNAGGGSTCHYYCKVGGSSEGPGLGGCPTDQLCMSQHAGQNISLGVAGVGLCFPDPSIMPDAGDDAGDAGASDAGDAGASDAGDAGASDAGDAGDAAG